MTKIPPTLLRLERAAMRWYHWLTGGRGERQLVNFTANQLIYKLGKACAAHAKRKVKPSRERVR